MFDITFSEFFQAHRRRVEYRKCNVPLSRDMPNFPINPIFFRGNSAPCISSYLLPISLLFSPRQNTPCLGLAVQNVRLRCTRQLTQDELIDLWGASVDVLFTQVSNWPPYHYIISNYAINESYFILKGKMHIYLAIEFTRNKSKNENTKDKVCLRMSLEVFMATKCRLFL